MLIAILGLGLLGLAAAFGVYRSLSSGLPDIASLRQVEMQEPLYVHAADGKLMAVFGETRRYPIDIADLPEQVKRAFVAAEDSDFYKHGGIDPKGISRAVWQVLTKREGRVAGGSTITQQVARQFFLSNDYSYVRKAREMLLAMRIEKMLTKDQILELYLNKSFFGNRAYGIAAAAEYYYGKPVKELSLLETATLVSSLKFPSSGNPISNPERNRQRSMYVVDRMLEDGYITPEQAQQARAEPPHAAPHEPPVEFYAPYVAEMVRQEMLARYGEDVFNRGYHVYTTIDADAQAAADRAIIDGLSVYDHRHGWHGVERHVEIPGDAGTTELARHLTGIPAQGALLPAIVAGTASDGSARAVLANGAEITLKPRDADWLSKSPAALLARGDVIRVKSIEAGHFVIDQVPRAQAALVSIDADTGALRALVGGYNYAGNKFNRATQARRQPGSSFKPFVYAASFDKGFNPASIVLDAPVMFRDRVGHTWQPQNDDGEFRGPMRLREALVQSRNLVSVRLLDSIGVDYARKYISSHFGFVEADLPPNLSMSLGAASLTPLSIARGYAVFANGGSLVTPWFIDTVKDRDGKVLFKETPAIACRGCGTSGSTDAPASASDVVDGFNFGATSAPPATAQARQAAEPEPNAMPATAAAQPVRRAPLVADPRTMYQLVSMMRDVVLRGTGTAAKVLGREDIGGKTGSTNNHRDAWFSGFGGPYATTVWVGRDDFSSLGYREYGGKAALPIWVDYMRVALKDKPIRENTPPEGMVQATLNGATEWVKTEDLDRIHDDAYDSPQTNTSDDAAFDIF